MKHFLLTLSILSMTAVYAQQVDKLPDNPEHGKCYAKCVEPDIYDEKVQRILMKPAYKKLKVIPAQYKTVTEKVVVKPASKRFVYVPAQYKTVNDTIWTKDSYDKISVLPAKFADANQTITIKPAHGRWVAGEKDPHCPSIDPEDCRIFHYKMVDEVKQDVPVQKLVSHEIVRKNNVRGTFNIVKKQVEVRPASYREEMIPAQTKEVPRKVRIKNETTSEIAVPAVFKDIKTKNLVKQGGMTVWREIPCTLPKEEIVLPINWKLSSSELTDQAKRIIDTKLLPIARKKSDRFIEVGSHTDARGSKESNQHLSEERAKSVVEYLIGKGIKKDRLLAVGYGETKLKNKCADGVKCSDGQHAANRRTEFKVY